MNTRDFDLLVVGDVNVDIILSGMAELPRPGTEALAEGLDFRSGGSASNCARAAARLGAKVAFMGLAGADSFGDFVLQALGDSGVNLEYARRSPDVKTGVTVSLSLADDRAFATYLGSVAAFRIEDIDFSALGRARHLHVGGYFLQRAMKGSHRALFQRAKDAGLTTSLDTGWDPDEKWNGDLRGALGFVDIALPNEVEALHLTGATSLPQAIERLAPLVPIIVLKLGADGSLARAGDTEARAPAFPVTVRDTTALGDCFNAGFLLAHLEGAPLDDCLRMGNAAAAIAASRMGDDRYARREEVERLLTEV
jgi:sugar/nucleoside kinase (ribokinase family)